jgi:hypothetical protein
MLAKFKEATDSVSEVQKPQIQYIWQMYDRLFNFLDDMLLDLDEDPENQDDIEWPAVVRAAAEKGREKLKKYYAMTDDERGLIFNCATVLDPNQKLTAYEV